MLAITVCRSLMFYVYDICNSTDKTVFSFESRRGDITAWFIYSLCSSVCGDTCAGVVTKNAFIPIRVNNIIFPCKRLVGCNFFSQLAKAQCKILFHKILTNNHPPSVIMHRKRSAAGLYIDTFMLSWIRCQGQSMGELEPYGTSSTSFAQFHNCMLH